MSEEAEGKDEQHGNAGWGRNDSWVGRFSHVYLSRDALRFETRVSSQSLQASFVSVIVREDVAPASYGDRRYDRSAREL